MLVSLLTVGLTLTPPKPNIVYIMCDDLGYGDVFGAKAKVPTPNIHRIADEGVRLTRFYSASPVCAPSRYSLLTGKHQGHATIRGNKEQGGFGPNDTEGQFPLPLKETTIAEVLKGRGYATMLVGKWGLGGPNPEEHPMAHGFDRFYGYLCQRRAHSHYPAYLWKDHGTDLLAGNAVYNAHQKIAEPLASEEEYHSRFGGKNYAPARMADAAVQFIRVNKQGPFFLYYAPTLPHLALQAPNDWIEKFPRDWDEKPYLGANGYLPSPRPHATFAAMLAYLDHTVGQILDELDKQGLTQNTLVFFTSDNGGIGGVGGTDLKFFDSNDGMRAGKMSLYEGGIRMPTAARWPGVARPGAIMSDPLVAYDSFATLAEAAGAKPSRTDGLSFLNVLRGHAAAKRPYLYFEYPEASAMQAVIDGRWKVIRPDLKKNPDRVEVYDLETDRSEAKDLAKERPDLVRWGLAAMKREHVPSKDFPLGVIDK